MRVEERAGKGEHSRNVPSRGDAETPAVWREELALQPSSPLLAKTSISLFRRMQNYVKCLRLTWVSLLGIFSFTNEFIAASFSYKDLLLLLCYFLFSAVLPRCSVSLADY